MEREELERGMLQKIEDMQEQERIEKEQDRMLEDSQLREGFPMEPSIEEQMNPSAFLHRAAFDEEDTSKTTYLTQQELGKPLFSVRFLMELKNIAHFHLTPIMKEVGLNPEKENRIANYFWDKVQNISNTGLSNEGFAMNLNVTRKMDMTRKKTNENLMQNQVKGG